MSKPSPLIQREFPTGLIIVQACIIPLAAIAGYMLFNPLAAKSAAIGAFISWLGSGYATWKAFRLGGNGGLMLAAFYQGLIGKFVIVIMGFYIVFRTVYPLSGGALLLGFAAVQAMAWVYPMWQGARSNS